MKSSHCFIDHLRFAFCALAAITPIVNAQDLSPLSNYSVITSGDFSTNSDVEGRTMVGGNLTGTNSSNFGIRLQGNVPASDLTLRVAGNISTGNPINVNAGSIELGGTNTGRMINFNGGGSLVSNPGVNYTSIINQLTSASQTLAGFQTNSIQSIPTGQPGPLNFTATPNANGVAVLLIDGTSLFNNDKVQQIGITTNGARDILINVGGRTLDWQYGNLVGLFTDNAFRDDIVWNFYEATNINFGSRNMMGQVLAPFADVTTQGNIDGSIFAKSLYTTSEVHLPGYAGTFQGAIPEPSSAAFGMAALLLLGIRRKVSV